MAIMKPGISSCLTSSSCLSRLTARTCPLSVYCLVWLQEMTKNRARNAADLRMVIPLTVDQNHPHVMLFAYGEGQIPAYRDHGYDASRWGAGRRHLDDAGGEAHHRPPSPRGGESGPDRGGVRARQRRRAARRARDRRLRRVEGP